MKYVVLLLVGILLSATVLPIENQTKQSNNDHEPEVAHVEPASESALEEPEEPVVEEETPTPEPVEEKPVDVVKDNPQNCNRETEWIYPDGSCHAKPVSKTNVTSTPQETSKAEITSGGCELVYNYSNWNQEVAHAVCLAESGGNTHAANYNDNHGKCVGSFGLMQLACFWIPNPTNPVANMAKANEIYSRSGWQPWGAYTSGKYLKYLR